MRDDSIVIRSLQNLRIYKWMVNSQLRRLRFKLSYTRLPKYLRHCTLILLKWLAHDLVLVIPPPPLVKVVSNKDHAQNLAEQL